jgi:hypothetical protein
LWAKDPDLGGNIKQARIGHALVWAVINPASQFGMSTVAHPSSSATSGVKEAISAFGFVIVA